MEDHSFKNSHGASVHPEKKKKKKKNKTLTYIKKIKPLTHKKKEIKRNKKKTNPKTQTVVPDQDSE